MSYNFSHGALIYNKGSFTCNDEITISYNKTIGYAGYGIAIDNQSSGTINFNKGITFYHNRLNVNASSTSVVKNAGSINIGVEAESKTADMTITYTENSGKYPARGIENTGTITCFGNIDASNNTSNQSSCTNGKAGGILNSGTITVKNSDNTAKLTVCNNKAHNQAGGVYNSGTINCYGDMTISGNNLSNAAANKDYGGGGLYLKLGTINCIGKLKVENNTVTGARRGGGIYFDSSTLNYGQLIVSGNQIGMLGGGICIVAGTLTLNENATITSNSATFASLSAMGGGIFLQQGTLVLSGATIASNTAKCL